MGESKEETEVAAPRNANRAVRRSRAFVVVDLIVVDFMGGLMGANRITFEYKTIRLVGWAAAEKTGRWRRWLFAEEIDEEFRDASGFFVLEPV